MNQQVGYLDSWQGISGIVTLIIGGILFVIFLIGAVNRYRKPYKVGFVIPWHLALVSIAVMLLIYSSAALSATHTAWITIFLLIAAVLIIFFVYSLFAPTQDNIPDWMEPVWTPRKGYGGTIFGDFANAMGVAAGVGAYAVSPLVTWWWLGHAGAILATLVGVSLAVRWMRATHAHNNGEDDRARKWFAFYNVAVGIGTLVSVMAPSFKNNQLELDIVNSWPVLIIWGILLLAFFILSIVLGVKHKMMPNAFDYRAFPWVVYSLLFIIGIAFLAMFKPIATKDWSAENLPKYSGLVFGVIAGFAWVSAEIHNVVNVLKSLADRYEKGFKITKSVFEVLGGLLLIIFVFLKFFEVERDNLWVMVVVGAVLAGIGTLLGMFIGIVSLRRKQKQSDRRAVQMRRIGPVVTGPVVMGMADPSDQGSETSDEIIGDSSDDRSRVGGPATGVLPVPVNPQPVPDLAPVLRRAASDTNLGRSRSAPAVQRTASGTNLGGRGKGN